MSTLEHNQLTVMCATRGKRPFSWRGLVTVLHTYVSIMLECISMQNLIKIYHVVQELWEFLLKYLNRPK